MTKEQFFEKVQERAREIKNKEDIYNLCEEELIRDFDGKIEKVNTQLDLLSDCILELADMIFADDDGI